MSISSTSRKAGPYTANGSTTAFPFLFKVFQAGDMLVVRTDLAGVETILTLGTDYTVSLNADQDANPGGSITTTSAPTSGFLVTLTSALQNLQPVVLTNNGKFFPTVINDALDRVTILVQQLAEQVSRAVKTKVSDSITPDSLLAQFYAYVASALSYSNAAAASASAASSSQTASATSASQAAASATSAASAASSAAASAIAQIQAGASSTQAQFDNSTSIATDAFVQRALGNRSSTISYSAAATQPVTDFGKLVYLNASTTFALVTPSITGVLAGASMVYANIGSVAVTLTANTGVVFNANGTASLSSLTIYPNETITVVWDGTSLYATDFCPGSHIGSSRSAVQYNSSTTLTYSDLGKLLISGSSGGTFTLPAAAKCPIGAKITILMEGGTSYVVPAGSDLLYLTSGSVSSITIKGGDWIELTRTPDAAWIVSGGSTLSSIGVGQSWSAQSRTNGTTYTNATRKPIMVKLWCAVGVNTTSQLYIDGVLADGYTTGAAYTNTVCYTFVVPSGSSWYTTNCTINNAAELR